MLSKNSLLEVIYSYIPAKANSFDTSYFETSEWTNLSKLCKLAMEDDKCYQAMFNELGRHFTVMEFSHLFANDRCYRLSLKGGSEKILMLHISIICPYFSIYVSNPNPFNSLVDFNLSSFNRDEISLIKSIVMTKFVGYEEFPSSLANEVIYDISIGNKSFGEVTFFNAIFTDHII